MDLLQQVEKYVLNIAENGTNVNQEVEVDVDEQTEVIRVPKHNDVDALELMNDFIAVIHESFQMKLKVLLRSRCWGILTNKLHKLFVSKERS